MPTPGAGAIFWKALSPIGVIFGGASPAQGGPTLGVQVVRAGKAVTLLWNLVQSVPLPAVPYDPAALPTITIFDANNTAQVTAQAMSKVASGVYSYLYVTPAAGALGVWSAYADVLDASGNPSGSAYQAGQAKATPVFQLV